MNVTDPRHPRWSTTTGQRIRTMTDEDLAARLREVVEVLLLDTGVDGARLQEIAMMLASAADRLDMTERIELHAHTPHWYAELGGAHGHAGHVTLAEIRDAERTGWEPPAHEPTPPSAPYAPELPPKLPPEFAADFETARAAADDCDTCWYLITDTAHEKLGDPEIARRLRAHLASGHKTTSEDMEG